MQNNKIYLPANFHLSRCPNSSEITTAVILGGSGREASLGLLPVVTYDVDHRFSSLRPR